MAKAQDQFLAAYEREHETTMRVLAAYPPDKADLRPHPKCKTARELAWIFVLERYLGTSVLKNQLAELMASGGGKPPDPPERWEDVIAALQKPHRELAELVASYTDEEFHAPVTFMVGPGKMGDWSRRDFAWFLLHDQIHHRGQLSVYLRMADGKVPSIYGPSADEPWM